MTVAELRKWLETEPDYCKVVIEYKDEENETQERDAKPEREGGTVYL